MAITTKQSMHKGWAKTEYPRSEQKMQKKDKLI